MDLSTCRERGTRKKNLNPTFFFVPRDMLMTSLFTFHLFFLLTLQIVGPFVLKDTVNGIQIIIQGGATRFHAAM